MQQRIHDWLRHEWVALRAEGSAKLDVAGQTGDIFAPQALVSDASVAVELWAMRATDRPTQKMLVEDDPPAVPLRYLSCESVVALSGVTSVLPSPADQVMKIPSGIGGSLAHAGVAWSKAVKVSCFLHRGQSLGELRTLLALVTAQTAASVEYGVADGYSTGGKLTEIEITARR